MKSYRLLLLAFAALSLSACNMTLAADVTPPPNYVSPTAPPTLGALYPSQAPNVQNGKKIYAEKCVACHGETGLGDGVQSKDLPVPVAPFGLPEFAQKASLADWYAVVTQGRIERFMPPFNSLSAQERWDVVSYVSTFHVNAAQLELGEKLFDDKCADCAAAFSDLQTMSALSENDLVALARSGKGNLPAFGKDLTDDEIRAVAVYIRTLIFAPPSAPIADSTPEPAPAPNQPAAEESVATVKGHIVNKTGEPLPNDLRVTLRVFEHGVGDNGDISELPQSVVNVEANGDYSFNTTLVADQIYLAEVIMDGVSYQTDFVSAVGGETEIALSDLVVYAVTSDLAALQIDSVAVHFDYADENQLSVFVVYLLKNSGEKTIRATLDNDNQEIPFIKAPNGAQLLGYQQTQDGAALIGTEEQDGFFIPPSEETYGIIAFANLPRSDKFEFSQHFLLPVRNGQVFLPKGVSAKGAQISDNGLIPLQDSSGKNLEYQTYSFGNLSADSTLTFSLKGKPSDKSNTANWTQNQGIIVGVGALGLALIGVGVFIYLRDRKRGTDEGEEEEQLDDNESIIDAVITLDDLYRNKKIADAVYKKRRAELVELLKKNEGA